MDRDLPLTPSDKQKSLQVWEKKRKKGRAKPTPIRGVDVATKEDSNRRVGEGLVQTFESSLDNDGVDVYTYFAFYRRAGRSPNKCKKVARNAYRLGLLFVVLALQVLVPFILLVAQLSNNSDFLPISDNFWFRFSGSIIMFYSAADLYRQIVNQVNWIIIDNNKIIRRIDTEAPRPKTVFLRLGLYINMIMLVVVITNTYLLFCMSQKLLDLILNMLALNFFLGLDNYAFKMMADYARVEKVIKAAVEQQIEALVAHANSSQTKISTKMGISPDYILFYIVVLYASTLPLVFFFYRVDDLGFGAPCLGAGNATGAEVDGTC